MAIVVPILMAASGASAAIGAAVGLSATAVSAISAVAFTVTGISKKIDAAASKVFGADLVKVADLVGAGYMAFSGGFGGGGETGGLNAVNGADAMSDAYTAGGSSGAGGFGSLASMAPETMDTMSEAASAFGGSPLDSQADGVASMGGDAADFKAGAAPGNVLERMSGPVTQQPGQSTSLLPNTTPSLTPQSAGAAGTGAAAPIAAPAAAPNASAQIAAAPVPGVNPSSGLNSVNGADVMSDTAGKAAGLVKQADGSWWDPIKQMFIGKDGKMTDAGGRMAGALLMGAGQGFAGYLSARQQQQQADANRAEERRRMSQSSGIRITQ